MKKRRNCRSDLLRAARRIIFEQGPGRLTTRAVANAAGVSEPAMYRHFTNKEELLLRLLQHLFRRWRRDLRQLIGVEAPAAQRLAQLGHTHLRHLFRAKLNPILFFGDTMAPGQTSLRSYLLKNLHFLRATVHTILQQGVDRGEFRPDLEVAHLTAIFIGTLQGAVISWTLTKRGKGLAIALEARFEQLFALLRPTSTLV